VDRSNCRAVWAKLRSLAARRPTPAQAQTQTQPPTEIDIAWLLAQAGDGGGEAVVLEPESSALGIGLAHRGWRVWVVAPRHRPWPYHHRRLRLLRGTIADLDYPGAFDLVVARANDDPHATLGLL